MNNEEHESMQNFINMMRLVEGPMNDEEQQSMRNFINMIILVARKHMLTEGDYNRFLLEVSQHTLSLARGCFVKF